MKAEERAIGIFLSILWMGIAFVIIGFTVYLFINGSSLFVSKTGMAKVDFYTEKKQGVTIITGSIENTDSCPHMELETFSDYEAESFSLAFSSHEGQNCSGKTTRIPFTASVPLSSPRIFATFNGNPVTIIEQK